MTLMSSSKTPSPPASTLNFSVVLSALVAARVALTLTGLPDVLRDDHQLASPLTSFSQLQEGIYLFNHGVDPYSGGTFRHSPLFLTLFATILPNSPRICSLLWTLCDGLGAWALVQIWRARQNVTSSERDGLIAAVYLFNPYIFLPTLALSTSSLENTLMLILLMFAARGKASPALLGLAFLVHFSLSSIVLLSPILLLLNTDQFSHLASPRPLATSIRKVVPLLGEFVVYFCLLALSSTLVSGGFAWIPQTWGATLMLPDLTPNPGLWWYFFTEIFDHFRPFFLMVFTVHLLIYIVPVCIKFQHDALYATFILLGIVGAFKAYPTLSDPGLFLSMISLFPEIYPYLRHPIVTSLLHLHAFLLLPLFHHLWLNQGTGNANFFYASTLVFACANGAAIIDCLWAGLRIAIGKPVEGYSIVQE
ncbi:GPI transamidase subunit PIG-U [Crucibulum laeve]|uniref:GPI transamidase subunit PIG-U n=1 Tax=Crucibulum laeve TaxID=68775 RepID=A0A5C3MFW4_9AGAR|nr:GPI transamidase subunit PIG-U [Crucibulum laeve]